MSESLTEILVERFYRTEGYLVERCVPIADESKPQFWSDLDVLAIRHEVALINCKDFISDPKHKTRIIENLNLAETWVRKHYPDLVATKPVVRRLVYGGSDKATLEVLGAAKVECIPVEAMLAQYLRRLESTMDAMQGDYRPPKGKRWYRIGNLASYDKLFVYLLNHRFLKVGDAGVSKWESPPAPSVALEAGR